MATVPVETVSVEQASAAPSWKRVTPTQWIGSVGAGLTLSVATFVVILLVMPGTPAPPLYEPATSTQAGVAGQSSAEEFGSTDSTANYSPFEQPVAEGQNASADEAAASSAAPPSSGGAGTVPPEPSGTGSTPLPTAPPSPAPTPTPTPAPTPTPTSPPTPAPTPSDPPATPAP